MATLTARVSSVNTDHKVTSLPVRAVVGMAISEAAGSHFVQAHVIQRGAGIGYQGCDGLGRIEGAAPSDPYDHVAPAGLELRDGFIDQAATRNPASRGHKP